MKTLIELIENTDLAFNRKNVIRLVKCLDECEQVKAVEILLGQEDFKPMRKYLERNNSKYWYQYYNPLTNRVYYDYKSIRKKDIEVPLKAFQEAEKRGYTESDFIWDSKDASEKFFHSIVVSDKEIQETIEIKIEYWGRTYPDSMDLKNWTRYMTEYNEMKQEKYDEDGFLVEPSWH